MKLVPSPEVTSSPINEALKPEYFTSFKVCSLPPFRCSNIITAPMIENNGQLKCGVAKGYNHSFNPTDEMGREKRAMG